MASSDNPLEQKPHLQVGEIGVKLTLATAVDLTAFTSFEMLAQKPNGVTRTFTASVDGLPTDGIIAYTFTSGDLDRAGVWTFQAQVEDGTGAKLIGEAVRVLVKSLFQP